MQSVIVVTVALLGWATAQDDCMPKPGDKQVHPYDCCKFANIIPEGMKTSADKCIQKFPPPPRPSGPPPTGAPMQDPAMKRSHACLGECIFSESGLLTSDKTLDRPAVMKYFATTDKDFSPIISTALNKCLGSYQGDIDQSLECKSGAAEFKKCLSREVFLNCPSNLWTSSSECGDLKSKVNKCPQMPVHMMVGGPRPQ
ncbi:general odorant-binding protein 67-like [Homalodisca vitripennis]|uniref:general odorant-binding protein 67-like n=1 Tax=Homalodisca vitripennis TaxID=197043 RepID=UPI001EEB43EF|nr:general odorant-binding protein 67-like [Homalodisca vitripennis]